MAVFWLVCGYSTSCGTLDILNDIIANSILFTTISIAAVASSLSSQVLLLLHLL